MWQEQLQTWWLQRRRKALESPALEAIQQWAECARERLANYGSLESCLQSAGIQLELSQQPHRVAGVRFRARLDLDARRLTLYAGALEELQSRCPDRALLTRVFLAHETFHLLCPECPGAVQEAAAHWFAASLCGLAEFPGIWDLPAE